MGRRREHGLKVDGGLGGDRLLAPDDLVHDLARTSRLARKLDLVDPEVMEVLLQELPGWDGSIGVVS